MTTRAFEVLVRVVAGLGLAAIAIGVVGGGLARKDFHQSVSRPVLQLELATSPAVFGDVLERDPERNIAAARRQITIDWFFIAAYWLAFLVLALRQPPTSRWTGVVVAAMATAGAGFDVLENRGILTALDASAGHNLSLELVRNTREASLAKWALLFAMLLLLAGVFLLAPGWRRLLGVLVAAGAAIGLGGLFCRALECELALVCAGSTIAFLGLLPGLAEIFVRPGPFVRSLLSGPS